MDANAIAFYVFGLIAVLSSLGVVGQRNPMYSVMLLITSCGARAGLYVRLEIDPGPRRITLGDEQQALEDVHRSEGEEMGLRVFLGTKSASVASSDLSDEARSARTEAPSRG